MKVDVRIHFHLVITLLSLNVFPPLPHSLLSSDTVSVPPPSTVFLSSSPLLSVAALQARLYMQQFYAMFLKRALYSWRNWKVMVAQFLVPLIFTVLALVVARILPGHRDLPQLPLALARYGPTTVPVALEPGAGPLAAAFALSYSSQLPAQRASFKNVSGERPWGCWVGEGRGGATWGQGSVGCAGFCCCYSALDCSMKLSLPCFLGLNRLLI